MIIVPSMLIFYPQFYVLFLGAVVVVYRPTLTSNNLDFLDKQTERQAER